ncbi:MAG: hypothetical protein ACK5RG_10120 [Cyclobacteriaceae bacterium]|jgi:hypothetical protein|nr:hypothetical protein [Flammeovirgaceae bacterium]
MGQARKDKRFKGVSPFADVSPNIFYDMDEVHIQKVFDLLTDRFGFPAEWRKVWKEHLDKQPRGADEIGLFLEFGTARIEPILNALLLRHSGYSTFAKLCEYIILHNR